MGTTTWSRTASSTTARVLTVTVCGLLALGTLTACGDEDDPAVTISPSVTPSATPESPTPGTEVPTDATTTPGSATPVPLPTPITTDKPTDRQTIPPQN